MRRRLRITFRAVAMLVCLFTFASALSGRSHELAISGSGVEIHVLVTPGLQGEYFVQVARPVRLLTARRPFIFWPIVGVGFSSTIRDFHNTGDLYAMQELLVAYYVIIAILALPAAQFAEQLIRGCYATLQRRQRSRLGLCTSCGYDVRASGERCPECGTALHTPPSER